MELKALLPLLGVIVGWFLKELSDLVRGRAEARAVLGTVLVEMLQLDAELRRLRMALTFQKNRPISWEQYEAIRHSTATRYFARTDPFKAVANGVTLLARKDPVAALFLSEIPRLLEFFRATKLEPVSKEATQGDYMKALSTVEVAVDLAEKALRKLTLKLAGAHSVITWCRVRILWRRQESKLAATNEAFVESYLTELYGDAKSSSETHATPESEAAGRR